MDEYHPPFCLRLFGRPIVWIWTLELSIQIKYFGLAILFYNIAGLGIDTFPWAERYLEMLKIMAIAVFSVTMTWQFDWTELAMQRQRNFRLERIRKKRNK